MPRFLISVFFLLSALASNGQTISQLGSWNNNANFTIRYYQDKVITSTTTGIQFIDVSNPTLPVPTASIGNPGSFPMAIEVDSGYAYFGGGMTGYFMVADISNLAFPFQVGITTDIYGTAYQIAISGDYAFMSTNLDTLYAIDISNKTAPVVVDRLYLGAFPGGIAVNGGYAYVGTTLGLKVVDISSPTTLTVVNSFGSGYGKIAPDFANQRLFVAKSSGFDAIDISSPTSPSGLFMGIGGASGGDICYWNNHVFQNGAGNTSAFSVTSGSATYIGSFNATFTGQVNGITVKDSVFYVSTVNDLHVLKLGHGVPTSLAQDVEPGFIIRPNPANEWLWVNPTGNHAPITANLYDINGQLLLSSTAENNSIQMDMRNLPAGTYLITVLQSDKLYARRVIRQ